MVYPKSLLGPLNLPPFGGRCVLTEKQIRFFLITGILHGLNRNWCFERWWKMYYNHNHLQIFKNHATNVLWFIVFYKWKLNATKIMTQRSICLLFADENYAKTASASEGDVHSSPEMIFLNDFLVCALCLVGLSKSPKGLRGTHVENCPWWCACCLGLVFLLPHGLFFLEEYYVISVSLPLRPQWFNDRRGDLFVVTRCFFLRKKTKKKQGSTGQPKCNQKMDEDFANPKPPSSWPLTVFVLDFPIKKDEEPQTKCEGLFGEGNQVKTRPKCTSLVPFLRSPEVLGQIDYVTTFLSLDFV